MTEPVAATLVSVVSWLVEEVGGARVTIVPAPTVTFGGDGTLHGHGGVNRFGGSYTVSGETIEFGPVWSTKMAGPEEAMIVEYGFLSVLEGARALRFDGELLVVGDGEQRVVLRPE